MGEAEAEREADMEAVIDRGEPVSRMEPMRIGETSRHRPALVDLALELARDSAGFSRSLPDSMLAPLGALVRAMNCYYSNLIEGHDTHPVDIERALRGDYSSDSRKRDLQQEARAHIAVQCWIDAGALAGRSLGVDAIREVHRRFCAELPEDLLWVADPVSGRRQRMVPGAWRSRDVAVGRHIAVSAGAVPRFLTRFEATYAGLGRTETLLAAAAAHHRLVWIHPFLDGNGRVARLISHAVLAEALDTGALWSVARGLARNVELYTAHLAACDLPRRNDLDGRGELSEESLVDFTRFFLETCRDQVAFMERLMQPDGLRARILTWAEAEIGANRLPARSGAVLEALLYRGALPRGEIVGIVGTGPRQARRVVAALAAVGAMEADSPRAPLRLGFPAALAAQWMPGLFPVAP